MTGPVGGRVELVAPRPVTDPGDRWRLLALVLLSVAVHAWLVFNTAVTAKDSIRFARHALALWKPNQDKPPGAPDRTFPDVLRAEADPPGYPLALAALYFPVKAAWAEPHSTVMDRALLAGQLASSLAAVLTVFPLYWLGRLLFSKWVGFGAAAVFQCLPVYARESSDAISDGLYLFFVATALLLVARGVKAPTVGRFLLGGLAVGLGFLVRPEGLLILMPCMAVVPLGLGLVGRWTGKTTAACLTALAVGVAIPAAPYVAVIGRLTNKPTMRGLIDQPPDNPRMKLINNGNGAVGGPPFGSWVPPDATGAQRVAVAAGEAAKEWLKGTHYSVGILAVVGLVFVRRRFRGAPELWVPVVFGAASAAAMLYLAEFKGYVSERHGLPLAMACALFAVAGLEPLLAWAARSALFWNGLFRWQPFPAVVCVAVILSGGRQLVRPLHDNRLGHKKAGEWLRTQLDPAKDTLVDPYGWAEFYSGWAVFNKPDDPPPERQAVRWAVLEMTEKDVDGKKVVVPDEPKLPGKERERHDMATEIYRNDQRSEDWKQVFTWPPADTGERPRVVVIRQDLSKKPKQ